MKDPMNYTKARGMLLAKKYLPDAVPFTDVLVVQTIPEWDAIRANYGDSVSHRYDVVLGAPRKNIVPGTNGLANSISELIKKVNQEGPEGAVIIMSIKKPAVPRYEYGGGFNVMFHLGHDIVIETVGTGFDGHELTRGLAIHERWHIPWLRIDDINTDLSEWRLGGDSKEDVSYWKVNEALYTQQRQARIDFLCNDCHYDPQLVHEHVPKMFHSIMGKLIAEHLMERIVLPLAHREATLARDDLWVFSVQGNFVYCTDERSEPQVWEIFRT